MPKALYGLLLGSLLLTSNFLQAQPDTLTYFPSDRVRGGAPTFYDTMQYLVYYPSSGISNHRVGTSVVAITITPGGGMRPVEIITSLGYGFDKIIRYAITRTRDIWLADHDVKDDIVVLIPFTFLFEKSVYYRTNEPPATVQREVRIVSGIRLNIRDDITLTTRANHHYVEKHYRRARRYLNELIRRNPYSKNLYRMRATARYYTRDREGACADLQRITTFLKEPAPNEAEKICLKQNR
ncbi:MAG: hypothetical protein WA958_12485 [Tunicatimonas sp.]